MEGPEWDSQAHCTVHSERRAEEKANSGGGGGVREVTVMAFSAYGPPPGDGDLLKIPGGGGYLGDVIRLAGGGEDLLPGKKCL